jgi:small subunit ribosomal protein S6
MLLFDARREDAEIEQSLERFSSLVTERGGTIDNVERWGRRRLAYEIADMLEGYYAIFTYTVEPDKRQEIEDALPFVEGFVRGKTVRPEVRARKY